ncbi:hypothetical protein BH10PSE16_BH10PSE16_36800 [soil metagenome]
MNRLMIAAIAFFLLGGCAAQLSEHKMNYLASALTKVSASVDATARYKRSTDSLDEAQLLRASTDHDPELMKPFEGMTVLVKRIGRDSAVLVCQANAGKALLEDTGCTAKMEVHRWRNSEVSRCEFTLDVQQLCAR